MRISDWSSDVCSSDLLVALPDSCANTALADMSAIDEAIADPHRRNPPFIWTILLTPLFKVIPTITQLYTISIPIGRCALIPRTAHRRRDLVGSSQKGEAIASRHRSEEHTSELQSLQRI